MFSRFRVSLYTLAEYFHLPPVTKFLIKPCIFSAMIDGEKLLRYIIREAEQKETKEGVMSVLYNALELYEEHELDVIKREFGIIR